MGTLPRTRSLSGADTFTLTRNFKKQERNRPASLCEASWNRIDSCSGIYQTPQEDRLRRTPSQANNLCTTVPTSIVNKTLGGRHTPTRSSLRHSRMAVMARNANGTRHQGTGHFFDRNGRSEHGRVTSLVIFSYLFVGVMGCLLALWLLRWVPLLPFKEVPHYAAGSIIVSGGLAASLIYCLPRRQKTLEQAFKGLLVFLLLASMLCCACVCVFDTLHLVNLAPMECRARNDVVLQSASRNGDPDEKSGTLQPTPTESPSPSSAAARRKSLERLSLTNPAHFPAEGEEGSGTEWSVQQLIDDEEGFPVDEDLEVEVTPLMSFDAPNHDIYINVSVCVCERRKQGWRIALEYPRLTCEDVKNVLPILLVASCVITIVGGVLSVVLLYIVATSCRRRPLRPSLKAYGVADTLTPEKKPFIYKSNFKTSPSSKSLNTREPTNGNYLYR